MKLRDKLLISGYFKEYYYKNARNVVEAIRDLESREFAYIDFDGVMKRHIALNADSAEKWIIETCPKDLYHSSAYYLFPDKEMGMKDWQGGDLIFDIDLDHLKNYKPNEIILCKEGDETRLASDEDECEEKEYTKVIFIDEEGILHAKRETVRLIEILVRDFDFKPEDIKIFFSGGRGFHIHIYREDILDYDSYIRMELKDYITLDGFDIANILTYDCRAIDEMRKFISTNDEIVRQLFSPNEIRIITDILRSKPSVRKLRSILNKGLRDKINRFVTDYIGVSIDGVVTVDTSRLIRAPYSLHGKTGLIKTAVNYENLDDFNPFVDAVREDESMMELNIIYMPEVYWYNDTYGPYQNERAIVPFSLGIYLISGGLGYGGKRL